METRPPRVLICSPSDATQAHIRTMLDGFVVSTLSTIDELRDCLRISCAHPSAPPLHFVIFDTQSEWQADDLAKSIQELGYTPLRDTKIIHLYTPVTDGLAHPMLRNDVPGLVRMTKPPRELRLLQTMAGLTGMPHEAYARLVSDLAMAVEDTPSPKRTLYGNVLVAEGSNLIDLVQTPRFLLSSS